MYYKKCPVCGAHLDPGETCDCKKDEDAPAATETPSQKDKNKNYADSSLSNPAANVNRQSLRSICAQTGALGKDITLVVRKVFPSFNRQLLAQCQAEKYGIDLRPEGYEAIIKHYKLETTFRIKRAQAPPVGEKLSQCEKVVRHMRDYGSITSLEAMTEYGIMRLASRISDLKRKGYNIRSVTETGKNRYGESTSYSRYSLIEEDDYET